MPAFLFLLFKFFKRSLASILVHYFKRQSNGSYSLPVALMPMRDKLSAGHGLMYLN